MLDQIGSSLFVHAWMSIRCTELNSNCTNLLNDKFSFSTFKFIAGWSNYCAINNCVTNLVIYNKNLNKSLHFCTRYHSLFEFPARKCSSMTCHIGRPVSYAADPHPKIARYEVSPLPYRYRQLHLRFKVRWAWFFASEIWNLLVNISVLLKHLIDYIYIELYVEAVCSAVVWTSDRNEVSRSIGYLSCSREEVIKFTCFKTNRNGCHSVLLEIAKSCDKYS